MLGTSKCSSLCNGPEPTLVSSTFKYYLETLWGASFELVVHGNHQSKQFESIKQTYSNSNHQVGRTIKSVQQNPFQIGDILWKEPEPYTAVVLEEYLSLFCSYCLNKLSTMIRCSGCSFVYYCGKDCQLADWTDHKVECWPLKKLPWPAPVRLMARAIHKKRRESNREGHLNGRPTWGMIHELFAHPLALKDEETCALMSVGIRKLLDNKMEDLDSNELMRFFAVLKTNGLCVSSPLQGFQSVAQALYVGTALVNHSCDPNAEVTFDGRQLVLKCLKPIRAGDEISVSYLDRCQTKGARQKELLTSYQFQCSCSRCERETLHDSDEHPLPTLSSISMQALEELEAGLFQHDPRLQPRRIQVLSEWKSYNFSSASRVSLSRRIHATYSYHLGPQQPLTLFHELDILHHTSLWLSGHPHPKRLEALKQQFQAWLPKARLWFSEHQLNEMEVYFLRRLIFECLKAE